MICALNMVKGENADVVTMEVATLAPLNIFAFCVLILFTMIVGICVAMMNETVHMCQFRNAYPDEDDSAYNGRAGGGVFLQPIFWGFYLVFTIFSLIYASSIAVSAGLAKTPGGNLVDQESLNL